MILGVSMDSVAENRAFAEKEGFTFPLLCDTDKRVSIAYGAAADASAAYPRRRTIVVGPDGKIEQIVDKVDVRTHPETLLESLPAK